MWQSTSRYPALQRQLSEDAPSMVWLQVDRACIDTLRQVVIRAGGDTVRFLRIEARAGDTDTGQVRALLCVQAHAAPVLRQEVLRRLPACIWSEAPRRAARLNDR